jgi:hypothetical protein
MSLEKSGRLKPKDTPFCCGVPNPEPLCDDCPMRDYDIPDAKAFCSGVMDDWMKRDPKLAGKPSKPAERLFNLAKAFMRGLWRAS